MDPLETLEYQYRYLKEEYKKENQKEQIVQNYIMTTIHFLKSIYMPGRLDFYIEEKIKKGKEKSYYYTDLFLEDAFEFCDLVFEKNEDKVYFLKQYLHHLKPVQKSDFATPFSGHPKEIMLK